MKKLFKVPVIVTKSDDFGEVLFDAQGTGEYWDIMSNEYETAKEALEDIFKQLLPVLQEDLSTYKELIITNESDILVEDNQKIAYLDFSLEV